jgi:hypothetical protein
MIFKEKLNFFDKKKIREKKLHIGQTDNPQCKLKILRNHPVIQTFDEPGKTMGVVWQENQPQPGKLLVVL